MSVGEDPGSSSDLNLNVHLHYPHEIDRSLNEAATDKIRKYRADYNNNPPKVISFIPVIVSTSGRLHSEFVRLLFLQAHRETERFFLQLQEFSLRNITVHSSTSNAWRSPENSNPKLPFVYRLGRVGIKECGPKENTVTRAKGQFRMTGTQPV
jgi:hypothetical protein